MLNKTICFYRCTNNFKILRRSKCLNFEYKNLITHSSTPTFGHLIRSLKHYRTTGGTIRNSMGIGTSCWFSKMMGSLKFKIYPTSFLEAAATVLKSNAVSNYSHLFTNTHSTVLHSRKTATNYTVSEGYYWRRTLLQ